MSPTIAKNQISLSSSGNWHKQEDVITANDVIDAYFKGKEDGKSEQERVNRRLFFSNLEKAQYVSESLFEKISLEGIHLEAVHLKAETITSFCALFIADKNDFIKDEFRNVFIRAREAKIQSDDETFSISFLFTPNSSSLNGHRLASDGYLLTYYGKK